MVAVGMNESQVEPMAALEEHVSQKGQVRLCLLWVCSVLQNLETILAILISVKKGVIQLLFLCWSLPGWVLSGLEVLGKTAETGQNETNPQGRPSPTPRPPPPPFVWKPKYSSVRCLPHHMWKVKAKWQDQVTWVHLLRSHPLGGPCEINDNNSRIFLFWWLFQIINLEVNKYIYT